MKGILLVDKPAGITSHDVVDHIRRASGLRRVGHTGTLDPAATGLLILCLGQATRLSEFLTGMDKTYEGDARLGITTDSYDLDGTVVAERSVPSLTPRDIQDVFERFVGDIDQIPPMVSAVKVNGERLYAKARKGQVVDRPARRVRVYEFTALRYEAPDVRFVVRCSSGTYARSLCHDAGELLGCGAALASLRRTAVGRHRVEQAAAMDAFRTCDDVRERLMPMGAALDLPAVVIQPGAAGRVASGNVIGPEHAQTGFPVGGGWAQICNPDGDLLAVAQVRSDGALQPKRVVCEQP